MNHSALKKDLHQQLIDLALKKIDGSKDALKIAQESANEESRSTAGDKHDTAKAMAQLEVEKAGKNLIENEKLLKQLQQIDPSKKLNHVQLGAVVITKSANYFISSSLGKTVLADQTYFAISIVSPIGQAMKGLKKGDSFLFNGKKTELVEVF